jgi:uncharacterized phage protein (TIGR01671 family)
MRTIKFRGKRITNNEFFIGDLRNGIKMSKNRAWIHNENGLCEIELKTIGQFTGLTDKNGKEIFEGDILGGINSGDFIQWCDKCKSFEVFSTNDYCYSCEHDFFWCDIVDGCESKEVEVIGNIYDNPELLN